MALVKKLFNQYRTTNPFSVTIEGRVTIGESGAVGVQHGKGFSVVRNSAGNYTITLDAQNGLPDILYVNARVVDSTVRYTNVTALSTSSGSITLQCTDDAASNADPASGASLCFQMVVQNKTAF